MISTVMGWHESCMYRGIKQREKIMEHYCSLQLDDVWESLATILDALEELVGAA